MEPKADSFPKTHIHLPPLDMKKLERGRKTVDCIKIKFEPWFSLCT